MRRLLSHRAPLLAAISLAAVCLAIFLVQPRSAGLIGDITDVSRYEELRASFDGSPLVSHFPEVIPPEAAEIHMIYVPALFQGGTVFQLRLALPPARIQDLRLEYEELAACTFTPSYEPQSLADIPIPSIHLGPAAPGTAQPEFEILIIDAHPQGDTDFPWNHGYSYGVAFSSDSSEMVYWAEDW
jgi:hypothetical protein